MCGLDNRLARVEVDIAEAKWNLPVSFVFSREFYCR